jgi:hypothetical protein
MAQGPEAREIGVKRFLEFPEPYKKMVDRLAR